MNKVDDKAYYSQKTVSKARLHGEVASSLAMSIISGEIPAGDPLPKETGLGNGLSVSRTVYREAIKILGAKGLVVSKPRTGTRVAPRSHWNLLDPDVLSWYFEAGTDAQFAIDLFEMRRIVEPAASGLAAQRRTSNDLKEIGAALGRMEEADAKDGDRLAADLAFHLAVIKASRNAVLVSTWSVIESTLRWSVRLKNDASPRTFTDALGSHAQVFRAIAAGDAARASEAMDRLIYDAQEDTLQQISAQS